MATIFPYETECAVCGKASSQVSAAPDPSDAYPDLDTRPGGEEARFGERKRSGKAKRRLAAIVASDIVGYSRLMGIDEEGTLERFRRILNEIVRPKVEECGGRIFKTAGDGLLLEFPSVVEAARWAADVQTAVACLTHGALDYVAKPFELDEVRARVRQALEIARELSGFPRHLSIHVGGVVIADRPLTDLVPVARFGEYRGFLFASLSGDVPPLESYLGEARVFIDLVVDQSAQGIELLPGDVSYTYRANWKLQLENTLDAYHLTSVHPSYFRLLDRRAAMADRTDVAPAVWQGRDGRELETEMGSFGFEQGHALVWTKAPVERRHRKERQRREKDEQQPHRWEAARGRSTPPVEEPPVRAKPAHACSFACGR